MTLVYFGIILLHLKCHDIGQTDAGTPPFVSQSADADK
jgi:hypothetical protein